MDVPVPRFEKYESPVELTEDLTTLQGRAGRITRARRIGPIAVIGSLLLFLIVPVLLIWLVLDQESLTHFREVGEAVVLARISKDLEPLKENEEAKITRVAARKILARKMTEHSSPQWKELLRQQPDESVEEMESALAEFHDVTDLEVSEARRTLDAHLESLVERKAVYEIGRKVGRVIGSLTAPEHLSARGLFVWSELLAIISLILAIPAIISASIFRGGAFCSMFLA